MSQAMSAITVNGSKSGYGEIRISTMILRISNNK